MGGEGRVRREKSRTALRCAAQPEPVEQRAARSHQPLPLTQPNPTHLINPVPVKHHHHPSLFRPVPSYPTHSAPKKLTLIPRAHAALRRNPLPPLIHLHRPSGNSILRPLSRPLPAPNPRPRQHHPLGPPDPELDLRRQMHVRVEIRESDGESGAFCRTVGLDCRRRGRGRWRRREGERDGGRGTGV